MKNSLANRAIEHNRAAVSVENFDVAVVPENLAYGVLHADTACLYMKAVSGFCVSLSVSLSGETIFSGFFS